MDAEKQDPNLVRQARPTFLSRARPKRDPRLSGRVEKSLKLGKNGPKKCIHVHWIHQKDWSPSSRKSLICELKTAVQKKNDVGPGVDGSARSIQTNTQ